MDFGNILSEWEKRNVGNQALYKAQEKDLNQSSERNNGEKRSRLLRKRPYAFIDLHGLSRDDAWTALETFFEDSRRKGFEKLLVVHGKGNHSGFSGSEAILRDLTRQFIESCSFAGECGHGANRDGGSGATWVILKN